MNHDHFTGVAPVGCFKSNGFKLFDMIGNVWEWTSSPYQGAHDQHMGNYSDLRQKEMSSTQYVIKGAHFCVLKITVHVTVIVVATHKILI